MPPKRKPTWDELVQAVDDLEDEAKQADGYVKLFVRMPPICKDKDKLSTKIREHFGQPGLDKYKAEQTHYRHELKKQLVLLLKKSHGILVRLAHLFKILLVFCLQRVFLVLKAVESRGYNLLLRF